jgi:hypothetical protein
MFKHIQFFFFESILKPNYLILKIVFFFFTLKLNIYLFFFNIDKNQLKIIMDIEIVYQPFDF